MHDGAAGAADRLEAALDQLGPGLGQHLDRDIVGDQLLLDQLADKAKSVSEAAGKPTSISLKPSLTSSSNIRRLRSGPIGSTSA